MPTWSEILAELNELAVADDEASRFDAVRRRHLAHLHQLTGRPTIIYYSDWLSGGSPGALMTLEDMQGFMEAVRGLPGGDLDLVLHLPGGSPEATARIVNYLRSKFTGEVRAFVPLGAMSAGTMLALAADRIVMGRQSQLGPIDPQILQESQGRYAPARAIIEQFDRACQQIKDDPGLLAAWMPILQQYGTSLLVECESAEKLAKSLVEDWLSAHMFKGMLNAAAKAAEVASWFADYKLHHSHALGIGRDDARAQGVIIDDLEQHQALQDAVLSVHHATMHSLHRGAVKIIENHRGDAFVRL